MVYSGNVSGCRLAGAVSMETIAIYIVKVPDGYTVKPVELYLTRQQMSDQLYDELYALTVGQLKLYGRFS